MLKRIIILFSFLALIPVSSYSQTLVATYPFPAATVYNGFWGITQINDTLWIGSSSGGKLYKITKTGTILDSLTTPFTFNQGLAWDGSGFWIARNASGTASRLIKINTSGVPVDTISFASIGGSSTVGIGGIALDGSSLWMAVYFPDYTSYPYSYAYKIDISSGNIIDTIPLRGKQIQGIAVKGDTIFYVNDNFQSEPERIYAYRDAVGDTLFSFAAPDPDNDCDPRGLYWDGQNLWLMAYRPGSSTGQFRNLYKYAITGQGSPLITTNPASMNFGNVIIGTTGNQNLTINNVGTGKLIINSFTMTNPRFSITPNIVPDTIQPSQSKNYTVGFTPNAYDTTSGELRIGSNDLGSPIKTVTLRGKGVQSGPFLALSTTSFNYNNRRVNSLCGFTFNITNQGSAPLIINSVSFGSQRFSFDNLNITFPISIDTQRTRTFRIWFNPNSASTFNDSAVFTTNAVNGSSAKILLTGTGQNITPVLGSIMWESNIPDNPNTSSDDFQPKSLKQIGDVNGDGVNDIICATENYWTICYNGNASVTADTLWKFNSHFGTNNTGSVDWEDAMQIMNDLDGDGIQEVVIGCGGGNEEVYVLSGKTGRVIWEYAGPNTNYDGDIMGIRIERDFNGDGKNDVLISASGEGSTNPGRHSAICLNAVNGQVLFTNIQNSEFTYDVVATSTGGAIAYSSNGGPYGVTGFNGAGSTIWNYPIPGTLNAVWSLKQIPDINNDGNTDIVGLNGFSGNIFALSGSSGTSLWSNSLGSSNNGTVELLDDKDKNGFPDVTFSGLQTAFRIDVKTNTILWTKGLFSSYIRDAGTLGDITGDTIGEVLFSTQQPGKVFVLNGTDGEILFEYLFGNSINERADRVAMVSSVDGNQSNEFIAVSRDGRVKFFSGGPNGVIGISGNNTAIPKSFALYQNYPNPFNPGTQIKFDIPKVSHVKLTVFDILGREVTVLINGEMKPGVYNADWNASSFASGVYFYEIKTNDYRNVKKMILIK
jgi:outer membrane protein assembly factor BamB